MFGMKKIAAEKKLQGKTMQSFTPVNESIFMLDYQNPYYQKEVLEKGCSNVVELLLTIAKKLKLAPGALKVLPGQFACTSFNALNGKGQHILARNFDYRDAPCTVVWTHPENGYASIGIINMNFMLYGYKWNKAAESKQRQQLLLAPYVVMDGMNEAGLAIDIVEIKSKATKQETGKKPISTTVAMRTVLDTCATCEEAVEVFKAYDLHNAVFCDYHYHIVEKSGKSVIIEYINNEMRLFYPEEKEGEFPHQQLVNFYLSEDGDNAKGFGYTRWEYLNEAFAETKGHMNESEAMDLLNKCQLSYRKQYTRHIGHDVTSLWSAVYNLEEGTVDLCARMDYDHVYQFRLDRPMEVVEK